MEAVEAIRQNLDMSNMLLNRYLGDLEDADILIRPVPGANHIAWQLGHFIHSQQEILKKIAPGIPALPVGFSEAHSKQNAMVDTSSYFLTKERYLEVYAQQYAALLEVLERSSDSELDVQAPERCRSYAPTVGAAINAFSSHLLLHIGQFIVVRRKLGKPILI